ncbi:protein similar isoform X2 [Aethina tumida]|uniref:protein similar isoform X2 n=1 Tax=Aethina tumida TaxID=116153 RepID=UPI002147E579|nr:protein similar isoform X2 [Aethina tumida]
MVTKQKPPKEKRRNNEKRKEKSRDAARSRRSRETEIFTDLANALPLSQEQVQQLDKASVMRLAISYLKVRDMANLVPKPLTIEDKKLNIDDSTFLQTLDGFLLVLAKEGDFVYLSENVSDYLGITQVDLMGQNVFEYSHPCDHDEIKEILGSKSQEDVDAPKSFFIRLKCTLTSKGRSVNLKSATYKVIHCTGHIIRSSVKSENNDNGNLQRCLVAVGKPIPHPSNIEDPLPRQTFLTKHSLDMKFTHADDKILEDILGYNAEDLIGKSVYEYHHALDSDAIGTAYKCLFSKGQTETNRYRFLAKTGGYVWVVTQATLIYDKMQKPQSVVCVNYVISGVECKDEIYSASQHSLRPAINSTTVCINKNVPFSVNQKPVLSNLKVVELVLPVVAKDEETVIEPQRDCKPLTVTEKLFSKPETATTKIFAPRTEDMSKGFLTFSEDEPGLTMLKDEPDDLTHLAPVAGDVCIPLTDDSQFLPEMLLDDFLGDSFGPLLSEEPSDPFIAYRDFHDSSTPELLSPNLSKNSDSSLPSLNSPTDSLGDEDQMSTFMNLQMEDDDLAMKAPYIPMNMADDLPLLMSDDLMWNTNDKEKVIRDSSSSLAQLLSSSVNKQSITTKDHGGGMLNDSNIGELHNEKNSSTWSIKSTKKESRLERSPGTKRTNSTNYDISNKRSKNEPTEKMSSELLQQLMSNNHHRGRPKGKSNWLLDSGGQKAACISQPSDSVLMNLLDDPMDGTRANIDKVLHKRIQIELDRNKARTIIRKNSISLLDPEGTIPSLMDLTQQDYEVNAPVHNLLLGQDLLSALELANGTI